MCKIITTCAPEIDQYFDKNLLNIYDFGQRSAQSYRYYQYIRDKLKKKLLKYPKKLLKYSELEEQFLELYERAKTKEEDNQKQDKNTVARFFYCFKVTGKRNGEIFDRFVNRTYTDTKYRRNNEIQEIH